MPSDKKQLGFRAQPHLADQVEAYADLKDISKSEALRRIVERGIEDVSDNDPKVQQSQLTTELTERVNEIKERTTEIAEELELSEETADWSVVVARDAYIEQPINKGSDTVAASSVYLVGPLNNEKRTQYEVSEASGVSVGAIRECYREIAEERGIEVEGSDIPEEDADGIAEVITSGEVFGTYAAVAFAAGAIVSYAIGNPVLVGALYTLGAYLTMDRLLARYYTGSWVGTRDDWGGGEST